MKKLFKFSFFLCILFLSFLIFFFVFKPSQAPVEASVSLGDTTIGVEVVKTFGERALGLSGRENLKGGMWFVFPEADYYSFWMKDMKFPIDIIWVSDDFEIVDIKENVSPDSFPKAFRPRAKASFVLEVSAGFAKTYQVNIGDKVSFMDR